MLGLTMCAMINEDAKNNIGNRTYTVDTFVHTAATIKLMRQIRLVMKGYAMKKKEMSVRYGERISDVKVTNGPVTPGWGSGMFLGVQR